MAMAAAWKLRRIVENVRHVLAIELMCAAQALDLRAPLRAGAGAEEGRRLVRERVAPLGRDRVLSGDIGALAEGIAAGAFDITSEPSLA
jgi:histidine ammonia-lyase